MNEIVGLSQTEEPLLPFQFTKETYKEACEKAFVYARNQIVPNPKTRYKTSTGNLAFNAFHYRWEGENGLTFHVYVDEDIAPYMVFTNEPWISEKWHGKQNPNLHWWNVFCENFIHYMQTVFGGELTFGGREI